jgi:ELWxxDGT repeat protein/cysteine-rich repeat protein
VRRAAAASVLVLGLARLAFGTPLPYLVQDLTPGPTGTTIRHLTAAHGLLFFSTEDAGTKGVWRSDGTSAGTVLLAHTDPAAAPATGFTELAGAVFFAAADVIHGTELWRSDGTPEGTGLYLDIDPSGSSSPGQFTRVGDALYFAANDGTHGTELWRMDGSGTRMVRDVNKTASPAGPGWLTGLGDLVLFTAYTGEFELWRSDGTEPGTQPVFDINPTGSSSPGNLTAMNGAVFFSATDGGTNFELWRTDGSALGTRPVADIRPGPPASAPGELTPVDGTLFFNADDGVRGRELWKSDGSLGNAAQVRDIAGNAPGSFPSLLRAVGSLLYFSANDGTAGRELWRSDGTHDGTTRVADIYPGPEGGLDDDFLEIAEAGGRVYLRAHEPMWGYQLWESDGTEAGTRLVAPLNTANPVANADFGPSQLVPVGNTLFFTIDDGDHGRELWALLAGCGDGVLDPGEGCDDGNLADGDCCTPDCRPVPEGGACTDGDACTTADVCTGSGCAGTPISCDDASVCTVDGCDPATGCTHAPIDLAAVRPVLASGLVTGDCAGARIAKSVRKSWARARRSLDRAATAKPRRLEKLLRSAARSLRKGAHVLDRRRRGTAPDCRDALAARFAEARTLVGCLLGD